MPIRVVPLVDPDRSATSHRLVWLGVGVDGSPVGTAFLRVFTRAGQEHLAELDLRVHPAERRAGVGSALLDAAVAAARADGRRTVIAQPDPGSAGEEFLPARGFRKVLALTHTRLPLAAADTAALTALVERPHPGYRLTSWSGTVPDELLDTFTASRRAMDDMPLEDADYGRQVWDAARVKAAARAVEDRGDVLHTVAAVAESDGSIAGFTELVVPGAGTGDGQHYGTAVLPLHRGHGLGRWMKAESIRQAREQHPELDGLLTDTADSNRPMRSINDALGYVPTHTSLEFQLDL
ncbi:GNAT family N-acetyltransferase [Streptomyces sp. NBC_00370]|uniref:GNAT family N-acetyltransferase n=1 Tax=Streptomyces sp. NBC_00370 TaxID=2975728 RepID=UPI002E2633B6